MSEYLIQGSTLDNIAKPIQTLAGATDKISLAQMQTEVESANSEISLQAEKIAGILDMLDGKTNPTTPTVAQATPSISVSSSGLITATSTQDEGYVVGGTTSATKQLTTQVAKTWTPTTSNQTISSGRYLTGTQTIKGDANLKAENIKSGVSIFGVAGELESAPTVYSISRNCDVPISTLTFTNTSMTNIPTQFFAGSTAICSLQSNYIYGVYNLGTYKNCQYGYNNSSTINFTWSTITDLSPISSINYSTGQVKITLKSNYYFAIGTWMCFMW